MTRWETKYLSDDEVSSLVERMVTAAGGTILERRGSAIRFALDGKVYETGCSYGAYWTLTKKEETCDGAK